MGNEDKIRLIIDNLLESYSSNYYYKSFYTTKDTFVKVYQTLLRNDFGTCKVISDEIVRWCSKDSRNYEMGKEIVIGILKDFFNNDFENVVRFIKSFESGINFISDVVESYGKRKIVKLYGLTFKEIDERIEFWEIGNYFLGKRVRKGIIENGRKKPNVVKKALEYFLYNLSYYIWVCSEVTEERLKNFLRVYRIVRDWGYDFFYDVCVDVFEGRFSDYQKKGIVSVLKNALNTLDLENDEKELIEKLLLHFSL